MGGRFAASRVGNAVRRPRAGFMLQLLAALLVTLAVGGAVQYQLLSRRAERQLVSQIAQRQRSDVASIQRVHRTDRAGMERVNNVVAAIGTRPGVTQVALIDSYGIVVAAGRPGEVGRIKWDSAEQAQRSRSYAGPDRAAGGASDAFESVTPLRVGSRRLVLEVDESGAALARERSDLRHDVLTSLVLGLLVALPILYLVGARSLSRRYWAAVEDSTRDHLTTLRNHRAFQIDLRQDVRATSLDAEPLCLALVDIDDFKLVNDRFGHQHGDKLLVELGAILSGGRPSDRAYRIGGDEFAMLMPATVVAGARQALERVRSQAEARLGGPTVSIGMAEYVRGCSVEELHEQVDQALYESKRLGRNRLTALVLNSDDAATLEPNSAALQALLERGEIHIAFQPIYDLERQTCVGYEALARPDVDSGFAGPDELFQAAERHGRLAELDILCRAAALEQATGLDENTLLFLNVNPRVLEHEKVDPEALAASAEAAGLPPRQIVLEITEQTAARPHRLRRAALALRGAGFAIALDDVGAGNSGLQLLCEIEAEFVKIDRGVVASAVEDLNSRAVMHAIFAFAAASGSQVIAEGIETHAMLDLVRDGPAEPARRAAVCGQGYLLGRPGELPASIRDPLGEPNVAPPADWTATTRGAPLSAARTPTLPRSGSARLDFPV